MVFEVDCHDNNTNSTKGQPGNEAQHEKCTWMQSYDKLKCSSWALVLALMQYCTECTQMISNIPQ